MRKTFRLALGPVEGAAWGGFLYTHARIIATLDHELRESERMSLSEYEVLLHLSAAAGPSLRMSELASSLPLTAGGVTRVVDRLEKGKLVRRARSPADARSLSVSLTPAGRRKFQRANNVHIAGVRQHFLGRLSPEELEDLERIWAKLYDAEPGGFLDAARKLARPRREGAK